MRSLRIPSAFLLSLLAFAGPLARAQSRIVRPVDGRDRLTLAGHISSRATAANDRGRVPPSLEMAWVTITFAKTPEQEAELDKLLAAQQTPGSPDYHRWLTADEYADRFGLSPGDLDQVSVWLRDQGLTIAAVANGRGWIAVNGSASQIESAFQTEIHQYLVNGEMHFANSTAPSLPRAIGQVVTSVRGLNDFRLRPRKRAPRDSSGTDCQGESHCLAPADLATIYNLTPAWNAGINGSGQSVAVVGQSAISLTDIRSFRSSFNLPVNDPQVMQVPGSPVLRTLSSGDEQESDIDLEWAGAAAPNVSVIFVAFYNDVMSAVTYAIDNGVAPVVSSSYGACELETDPSQMQAFRSLAQYGNSRGITWFNASGDDGAADCGDSKNPGLSVDTPASVPEVTAVGGTEFVEGSGTFWNPVNDANSGSALSYIPETAWNDPASSGQPSASGGGVSVVFSQPVWQTGYPGVPADGFRHVPDVALTASADHDGYLVYTQGSKQIFGGTSVPTPIFAGIAALINQYLVASGAQPAPGLGNANARLYALAQANPAIFHDVTTGNNTVNLCSGRVRNCNNVPGYEAGTGYDSVTGLGSVDAWALVTGWNTTGGNISVHQPTSSLSLTSNLTSMGPSDKVFLTASVSNSDSTTPTGSVIFTDAGTSLGSVALVGNAGTSTAVLALAGNQLSPGNQTITATWNGASSAATASVILSVESAASMPAGVPVIAGVTNAASFQSALAPGMLMSVFGSNLANTASAAGAVPLPYSLSGVAVTLNGEAVPLLFVSPGQLNIQIPYEATVGSPETLEVNNNGQIASTTFFVTATAPGIFYSPQDGTIANGLAPGFGPGQIATLYLTGAGRVTPGIADAAAPAPMTALSALPVPAVGVSVSVGGVPSPSLPFVGITSGLVGVVQINFEIPASVPAGNQPVIVTIGNRASAPALLNVTN